jgi:hypothetical protein
MEPEALLPCSQDPYLLGQIEPVHTTPSYLSKIHLNIIHLPTSWSSWWCISFWLSHQYSVCIPLFSIRATYPFNLILLDVIFLIILCEEYKL